MTNTVNRNISYMLGRERFNFRVAGIVMNGDKILLHQAKQDDFWNLPGGKAELNESTEEAIKREMVEELGVSTQVQRLAFICEDFYEYDDILMHEIGFYYVISLPEAHSYYDEPEFNGLENDGELTFRWFPMEELEQMEIYPVFLRKELAHLRDASGIKHFIQK